MDWDYFLVFLRGMPAIRSEFPTVADNKIYTTIHKNLPSLVPLSPSARLLSVVETLPF
jgi:hypothetical protein